MLSDPQFWVALAFIIFIVAIFFPVRKILIKSLDEKIQNIKQSIQDAENIKNETQIILSDIKKRENEVQIEIKDINSKAQKKIESLETNAELKLQDQINKHKLLSSNKIDQIIRDANIEIKKYISENAIQATISVLKKNINQEQKQNLINQSIKELNTVLKN